MMEWSKENTLKLIILLETNEALWNTLSNSYRDKNKKRNQINLIAAAIGAEPMDIEKKVQQLRNKYNTELTKEKQKLEKPKWYAYKHLHFLRKAKKSKKSSNVHAMEVKKQVNVESIPKTKKELMGEDFMPDSNGKESVPTYKSTFSQKAESTTCAISKKELIDVKSSKSEGKDEFDVFGHHISNELRKLKYNRYALVHTKKKIYEALIEADLMTLESPVTLAAMPSTWSNRANQIPDDSEEYAELHESIKVEDESLDF